MKRVLPKIIKNDQSGFLERTLYCRKYFTKRYYKLRRLIWSKCFTITPSKIKMQTSQYRKSRIWEIKEDKHTKSLAKNQVCAIIHMREIHKKMF